MDATTFIIIAGMAFFFFLIPAKQFKQAFIAMAFVLFVSLAVITLSTEEFTMTEVITHDHFYTPQVFTVNDSDILEINEALANNWVYNRNDAHRDSFRSGDTEAQMSIIYQAERTTRNNPHPDRLNIIHSAITKGSIPNDGYFEYFTKILTTDTAIRKVILEIEIINIDEYIDTERDNFHTSLGLFSLGNNNVVNSRPIDGVVRPENGNHTITLVIPNHHTLNQIALKITTFFTLAADMDEQVLYRITGITIEKAPIPESKLEQIRETKTYPVITFGKLNIVISFIFIFLAMINLMIFISDTVQWKRKKSNKPL